MQRIDIAPTKSNLRKVKSDLVFAYEGFDLLNQKREILVLEIVKTIKKIRELEGEFKKVLDDIYNRYKLAAVDCGAETIASKSMSEKSDYNISVEWTRLMGISMPYNRIETPTPEMNSSLYGTGSAYDMIKTSSLPLLNLVMDYASLAKKVFLLSAELKKVQRRVNALEKIFIPAHEATKKYISDRLEEIEREEIFIKKLIGRRRM